MDLNPAPLKPHKSKKPRPERREPPALTIGAVLGTALADALRARERRAELDAMGFKPCAEEPQL